MEQKQLKYTIKIFGEGYTEWFYFDHLRTSNKFKFTVEPDMPQQSKSSYKKRLKLIDQELKKNIQERANAIFLITDLDDISSKPKELDEYHKKKEIYKNKGVNIYRKPSLYRNMVLVSFPKPIQKKFFLNL